LCFTGLSYTLKETPTTSAPQILDGALDLESPNTTPSSDIFFCSEFCEISYEKYNSLRQIYLKKQADAKLELENSLNKSLDSQTSTKQAIKWNASLLTEIKSTESALSTTQTTGKFEIIKTQNLDRRSCVFCNQTGDLSDNGPGRLLTMDVGKWCHLNCALWSNDVYETMAGSFINVESSYKRSLNIECVSCHQRGASVKCFMQKCNNYYHFPCSLKEKCALTQDKLFYCVQHSSKVVADELLTDFSVFRNVWVERDEVAQIQNFMSQYFDEDNYAIRVGSLILHNIGQLLPYQLSSSNFHTRDFIYPVIIKFNLSI